MSHDTDTSMDESTDGQHRIGNDAGSRGGILPGGSRRQFLKATAGTGAIALGSGYAFAHDNVAREDCEDWAEFEVGGGDFRLVNNIWGTENAPQDVDSCIREYEDGHYGWEWDRGSTDAGDPNYPEVILGTKPWGTDTGVEMFPVQFGDVQEMDVSLDVDLETTGENYNLALEWWHTEQQPGENVGDSITHEIMVVLEWGDEHGHGNMNEANAFTDSYGNSIDYWTDYDWDWRYHLFRVSANETPSNLDLASVVEYLDSEVTDDVQPLGDDLWVTGIEIGTEYWDNTSGELTFAQFDASVNGQTATSGGSGANSTGGSGSGDAGSGTGSSGSGDSGTGGTDGSGTGGSGAGDSGTGGSDTGGTGGSDSGGSGGDTGDTGSDPCNPDGSETTGGSDDGGFSWWGSGSSGTSGWGSSGSSGDSGFFGWW